MREFNVYDVNLKRINCIQTYESAIWEEGYNTLGTCMVEFKGYKEAADKIKSGEWAYLGLSGSESLCQIRSVETHDISTIIRGFQSTKILSERVSTKTFKNINAEEAMRELVSNMVPWENLYLGSKGEYPDIFTHQISDKSVLEYCQTIAQDTDMGFKIKHDKKNKKMIFECYKPKDSGNLVFATRFGNLTTPEISISDLEYKNVAIVAGEVDQQTRIRKEVIVGDTTAKGSKRREIYIDARDIQKEEGETEEQYINKLKSRGIQKLSEQVKIENISCNISSADFGKLYNLGDIATCILDDIGIKLKLRITQYRMTLQNNNENIELSFGKPIYIRRS